MVSVKSSLFLSIFKSETLNIYKVKIIMNNWIYMNNKYNTVYANDMYGIAMLFFSSILTKQQLGWRRNTIENFYAKNMWAVLVYMRMPESENGLNTSNFWNLTQTFMPTKMLQILSSNQLSIIKFSFFPLKKKIDSLLTWENFMMPIVDTNTYVIFTKCLTHFQSRPLN